MMPCCVVCKGKFNQEGKARGVQGAAWNVASTWLKQRHPRQEGNNRTSDNRAPEFHLHFSPLESHSALQIVCNTLQSSAVSGPNWAASETPCRRQSTEQSTDVLQESVATSRRPFPESHTDEPQNGFLGFAGIITAVAAWTIWNNGSMFPEEADPKGGQKAYLQIPELSLLTTSQSQRHGQNTISGAG